MNKNELIKGNLKFTDNAEYIINNNKGENVNISKLFDSMLGDIISIKITNTYKKDILFNKQGQLIKKKLGGIVWKYWIGAGCLDDVMFDISDRDNNKTSIEYSVVDTNREIEERVTIK